MGSLTNRVIGAVHRDLLTPHSAGLPVLYDTVKACYGEVLGACDVDDTGWTIHDGGGEYTTLVAMGLDAFVVVRTTGYGADDIRGELDRCAPYASIGFEEALEIVTKPLREKHHE